MLLLTKVKQVFKIIEDKKEMAVTILAFPNMLMVALKAKSCP